MESSFELGPKAPVEPINPLSEGRSKLEPQGSRSLWARESRPSRLFPGPPLAPVLNTQGIPRGPRRRTRRTVSSVSARTSAIPPFCGPFLHRPTRHAASAENRLRAPTKLRERALRPSV